MALVQPQQYGKTPFAPSRSWTDQLRSPPYPQETCVVVPMPAAKQLAWLADAHTPPAVHQPVEDPEKRRQLLPLQPVMYPEDSVEGETQTGHGCRA